MTDKIKDTTGPLPKRPSDEMLEFIREEFVCKPELGKLYRKDNLRKGVGWRCGTHNRYFVWVRPKGQKGKNLRRSHLVWFFHTGEWPVTLIDHINQDSTDDRIENLRMTTHRVNMSNRKDNNKYGLGVLKRGNNYKARLDLNGEKNELGSFKTLKAAQQAYDIFQIEKLGYPEGLNGLKAEDIEEAKVYVEKHRASRNVAAKHSGYVGVNWSKSSKKWGAYPVYKGKAHYLGLFECPHKAVKAINTFWKRRGMYDKVQEVRKDQ